MQFPLWALMILMVVVSVFCGLVFGAPPIVTLPVLLVILWISPSVWINGILYGRGAWRPFFIGGTMGGLAPHLGALYYSILSVISMIEDGDSWTELLVVGSEARLANIYIAVIFLIPGVFSLFGGLAGVWTYWMCQPVISQAKELPSGPGPSEVPPNHLSRRSREALSADETHLGNAANHDGASKDHG